MKATYTNPPFQSPEIGELEAAFLRAAIRHAGDEETLKYIFTDTSDRSMKRRAYIRLASKESALFQTGAMSEHNHAYFELEI